MSESEFDQLDPKKFIIIKGARANNLKNISFNNIKAIFAQTLIDREKAKSLDKVKLIDDVSHLKKK